MNIHENEQNTEITLSINGIYHVVSEKQLRSQIRND